MLLPLILRYPGSWPIDWQIKSEDSEQLVMATTNKPQATSHWSGALI